MQKGIIAIILVVGPFLMNAQVTGDRPSLLDSIEIVKSLMRENGEVNSYAIGYSGAQSKQFQRFVYLIDKLDSDGFLELTKDRSPCLRIYGYAGLVYTRFRKTALIKTQLQKDSSVVYYISGCGGGNSKVGLIISGLNKWYNRKAVTYALAKQIENREFWYKSFVFRN